MKITSPLWFPYLSVVSRNENINLHLCHYSCLPVTTVVWLWIQVVGTNRRKQPMGIHWLCRIYNKDYCIFIIWQLHAILPFISKSYHKCVYISRYSCAYILFFWGTVLVTCYLTMVDRKSWVSTAPHRRGHGELRNLRGEVLCLDSITDSVDMNLGKLQEIGRDGEAWPCCSPWGYRVGHDLVIEHLVTWDLPFPEIYSNPVVELMSTCSRYWSGGWQNFGKNHAL